MSKRRKGQNRHHRLPESKGGTYTWPDNNVLWVNAKLHAAWHILMSNRTAPEIAKQINNALSSLLKCNVRLAKR